MTTILRYPPLLTDFGRQGDRIVINNCSYQTVNNLNATLQYLPVTKVHLILHDCGAHGYCPMHRVIAIKLK